MEKEAAVLPVFPAIASTSLCLLPPVCLHPLFCRFLDEILRHQVLIGNPLCQHAGIL